MKRHRATTADELEARRRSLVAAAASLLARWSLEDVSVERVAGLAGLAKGTVYRYFATREELFLAVWEGEHEGWLGAMCELLLGTGGPHDDGAVSRAAVETAIARPLFCRLHGVVHTVLEANLATAAALACKERQLARARAASSTIASCADGLDDSAALQWLLCLDGVMAGLLPLAAPPPAVARALAEPRLHELRLDVERELVLVGAATLAARRPRGGQGA